MPKPSDAPIPEVIQAQRFDVVTEDGRLLARLGTFPGHVRYGIALYSVADDRPRERMSITLDADGNDPTLSYSMDGNVVLELGVQDPQKAENICPGPYIVLCDAQGQGVAGWSVSPGGELTCEHRSAGPSE